MHVHHCTLKAAPILTVFVHTYFVRAPQLRARPARKRETQRRERAKYEAYELPYSVETDRGFGTLMKFALGMAQSPCLFTEYASVVGVGFTGTGLPHQMVIIQHPIWKLNAKDQPTPRRIQHGHVDCRCKLYRTTVPTCAHVTRKTTHPCPVALMRPHASFPSSLCMQLEPWLFHLPGPAGCLGERCDMVREPGDCARCIAINGEITHHRSATTPQGLVATIEPGSKHSARNRQTLNHNTAALKVQEIRWQ